MTIGPEQQFYRDMLKRGDRLIKVADELEEWAGLHADQLDLRAPLRRYVDGTVTRLNTLADKLKEASW